MNFDKTFEASRKMYSEILMNKSIGIPVRIAKDNNRITMTLAKDFVQSAVRVENELLQYCLQATFLIDTELNQGDFVEIYNLGETITALSVPKTKGLVFSTITQDPVSKICSILTFNVEVKRHRPTETFNSYGEVLSTTQNTLSNIPVYLEKSTYRKVDYGVGQAREITATLYAHKDEDFQMQDIVEFGGEKYRIDNIDDIKKDNLIIADLSNFME